eukprot:gene24342-biopygen19411
MLHASVQWRWGHRTSPRYAASAGSHGGAAQRTGEWTALANGTVLYLAVENDWSVLQLQQCWADAARKSGKAAI